MKTDAIKYSLAWLKMQWILKCVHMAAVLFKNSVKVQLTRVLVWALKSWVRLRVPTQIYTVSVMGIH